AVEDLGHDQLVTLAMLQVGQIELIDVEIARDLDVLFELLLGEHGSARPAEGQALRVALGPEQVAVVLGTLLAKKLEEGNDRLPLTPARATSSIPAARGRAGPSA